MALRTLYGHHALRQRLARAVLSSRLPASLLLQGPRGVGKQRLALWLGQLLLCEATQRDGLLEPCGACQHCRYAMRGQHPDLHWFFPRPRLKDGDPDADEVRADLADAVLERMQADGVWSAPSGTEGLYVATVRALVQAASRRPAMASRAVFVVGDAERMVSQEGADQAANAFLKLLEEPPTGTTLVLTSSEPGALLPTIRSRVVVVRVPPLRTADVEAFLDDSVFAKKAGSGARELMLARASGAPGLLLSGESTDLAVSNARRLLDAALAPSGPQGAGERLKASARQGASGARGAFSDTLEALSILLHERSRGAVLAGHDAQARRTAQAVVLVEVTRARAQGNVSPNLLSAALLSSLHQLLVQ